MSSLTKTDNCSTNFSLDSTRKAPKMLNESSIIETCTDEVYAVSEDNGSDIEVNKEECPSKSHTSDNHGDRHHFLS